MASIYEIKKQADELAAKTNVNSIPPKEVGGLIRDLADYVGCVEINGGSLGIRKVYPSVLAMEADIEPIDIDGKPMRRGSLAIIYDGTETGDDNNKVYAYQKPGWAFITRLNQSIEVNGISDAPSDGNVYGRKNKEWESLPIEDLMNQVFPLGFRSFSGGGTFEVGQKVTPALSWSLERKNEEVLPEAATVNGSVSGISSDFKSYTGTEISSDMSYRVVVSYGTQSVERTASYYFRYKKYWGVSEKPILDSADVIGMSSTFAMSKSQGKTVFDCSGGKYPYYILPAYMAAGGVEVWVNGFKNTDIIISDLEITNNFNVTKMYRVIRLNNIQTGVLNVEFK